MAPALGYALVQLPFAPIEARLTRRPGAVDRRAARGDRRAARRLRRAAEDRTGLDNEVATLRRALTEADESVLSLTRKTRGDVGDGRRLATGLRTLVEAEPRGTGAELAAARDEADRLRAKLAEAEARATAAEQRLEEVGGAARSRQTELEDAIERLRLADSELARARRNATRFEQEARGRRNARSLQEREHMLPRATSASPASRPRSRTSSGDSPSSKTS